MAAKKSYRVIAPDRYLRVRDEPAEVVVRVGGEVVARSRRAVRLSEGRHADVLYLPREDITGLALGPSERTYACRWKGPARYYRVALRDHALGDVIWSYPDAPESLAALRERLAFDLSVFSVDVTGAVGQAAAVSGAEPGASENARVGARRDEHPA